MRNHKSVGKCNILKDVQDDENIHFCQDNVENINQATDGAQTSQSSVEKTESSQSNVEKANCLCSYKSILEITILLLQHTKQKEDYDI